jgi:hypothetical protein
MSALPTLPSAVASAKLPAGKNIEELTTDTVLTVKLDGPGFKARAVISKDEAEARENFAIQLVRDPAFNAVWLANYAHNIDLNTAPLEEVLRKTRALNVGEVGDLTVRAAVYMKNIGTLPKAPNAKFLEKVRSGQAKAEEMIEQAKWLSNGIEVWLRKRDNMLRPFTIIKAQLEEKFNLMAEQIVLNQQLAENEDQRTDNLTVDSATLEYASIHLPDRIKELRGVYQKPTPKDDPEAIKQEIQRLTGMANNIIKIVSDINPLIYAGNAAVSSYIDLANMAGGHAATLGLFLSAGIARWESDVVREILALEQIATGLALAKVEELMNAQSARAGEISKVAAEQYVTMMERWMLLESTMQKISDDNDAVKDIISTGFKNLVAKSNKTAQIVQNAKDHLDKKTIEFADKMVELAETGVIK